MSSPSEGGGSAPNASTFADPASGLRRSTSSSAGAGRGAEPELLGPYRVLGRVGAGGMGVVYDAEHVDTGARVAVKTVLVPDDALLGSIRREIRALGRVRHPGVVQVLEEGVEQNLPWYAMELLEGQTLRNYSETLWARARDLHPTARVAPQVGPTEPFGPLIELERVAEQSRAPTGTLPPAGAGRLPELLLLAERLCDSLAFLHGEGIVHRDLKPDNVFVRVDGTPVLMDFGLVGRFGGPVGREVLEVDTMVAGSAAYMAPEQIRGELVDARTDLYSFGCVLYECVAGRRPFEGKGVAALFAQHIAAVPRSPSELVSGLPRELERLLGQLLEKRPRERGGHASDVAMALAEIRGVTPRPAAPRELTPRAYLYRPELAGRDELIEKLEERLLDVKRAQGSFSLIGGESGAGKTRVALETARLATLMGVQVVGSECLQLGSAGAGAPLHALRPFLQAVVDRCAKLGEPATDRLLGHRARVLSRYEPALAYVPGIERYPLMPQLNAEAERARALTCLRETLALFCAEQPLFLVLDDLQWADELTLAFLDSLGGDFCEKGRIAVMGTYRLEEQSLQLSELAGKAWVRGATLDRLDAESVGRMVADMLGVQRAPAAFADFLARESEGNPFFVAEYLRAAVGEGLLFRARNGAWVVGAAERPLEQALPLPGTLRELVERRLSAVSDRARGLVEAASVLGRASTWKLLAAMNELGEGETMEASRELLERQVMEEPDSGRLRFVHDKLREVAYQRIPAARRRELHAHAAGLIEANQRGTVEFPLHYATLAHHYGSAGDDAKCFEYLERAGQHALLSGAHRDAIGLLSQAIERHAARPEALADCAPPERRAHWYRMLGDAWYGRGELEKLSENCLTALDLLGQPAPRTRRAWSAALAQNVVTQLVLSAMPRRFTAAPPERRARLLDAALAASRIGQRHYFANEAMPMVASSLMAVNLAERAEAREHAARPYSLLAIVFGVSGLHRLAKTYFDRWREAAVGSRDDYGFVVGAYTKVAYLSGIGDWRGALAVGAEGLEAAERLGDRHEIETVNTVVANVYLLTGDFARARSMFGVIRDSARERGNPRYEAWGLYAGGAALVGLGLLDEAVRDFGRAAELLSGASDVASEIICQGALAVARLRQGELDLARRAADAASQRIRANPPTVYSTLTGYAACAEVYLALWADARERGSSDTAELRRMAKSALFQLRLFAAFLPIGAPAALLDRARWQAISGKTGRARALLERATHRAGELGMPFERASALLELTKLEKPGSAERVRSREEARRLFTTLGASYQLGELERST